MLIRRRKSLARRPMQRPDPAARLNTTMQNYERASVVPICLPFGVLYIWQHFIGACLWRVHKKKEEGDNEEEGGYGLS